MDASAAEKPNENISEVPVDKREALAALKAKLGTQNPVLTEKLDPANKSAVLTELRGLSRMVTEGRVTGVTKVEIDEMHDEIEGAMLVSTRPVEELAQKGLDAFSKLDPAVKQAAIGTAAVGGTALGLFGMRKFFRGAKKAIVNTWDTTLDIGEAAVEKTGSFFKWLVKTAAVAGVGALTFMGIQRAMQSQAPAESTEKKT
jgi:hypothetical protein